MPWLIKPHHSGCPVSKPYGVVSQTTGRLMGCHPTLEQAKKQQAALYVNIPEPGRSVMTATDERAVWDTAYVNNLPDSSFAFIEGGGSKDSDGKTTPRSLRHFPIKDASGKCDPPHVRNALSRAPQSPFGPKAMGSINACAKTLGIGSAGNSGGNGGGRAKSAKDGNIFEREAVFTLERDDGDGRTLEGYAAVFNSPADIDDLLGTYTEVIKPGAFKRTLEHRTPPLLFNHGRHPLIGNMPIGAIQDIREDDRGLYFRARMFDNWLIEPLTEAIREQAVKGMSFRFEVPKGAESWNRNGAKHVRSVREVVLHELGPVVFPAYADATAALRSLGDSIPGAHIMFDETANAVEAALCAECGERAAQQPPSGNEPADEDEIDPNPGPYMAQDSNGDGICDHCGEPNGDHAGVMGGGGGMSGPGRSNDHGTSGDPAHERTSSDRAPSGSPEGDALHLSPRERYLQLVALDIK
jgi:HK97 family phage prohead protease